MTDETILANAQIILADEVITGCLKMQGDTITDIAQGAQVPKGAIDCGGDFVSPGMIELHTDNLERHISPRPKVDWPHRAAIVAHDRELAGCGITTVFDAIRVGSILSGNGKRYGKYARQMADEILQMRDLGALKISHHIHLRAEVCSETLVDELAEFGEADRIGIVSLMDHTPGQRQFSDIQKYEDYVCGKHGMDRAEFPAYVEFLTALQARLGAGHEEAAVSAAQRYGATLASHDDTTATQVATSHAHGITLAEFPTTVEAANACYDAGIATIMGAPNLVRGGSHSGNVAAHELARLDRLDILSSDYVPAALLQGAVQVAQIWGDWARGMATVTFAPAQKVHLDDRGVLAIGKRADVMRFAVVNNLPLVQSVWTAGRGVA
ncbi:phosphonate metabolism protein PhnM [Loktanella sp. D2R18]|uniref:alpha-D-ribose 1-methylphosphonate 5-triphosphate diphosphatase n=1 Tax=Rhodobacterales TaxID=204455 RepID=UPI000DE96370|nr:MULTISPECIES: alpha-D-ribose 1-methylphosphonate 5-triphosphate diphosphatase [Rhodobacterales]MDO6591074.1 alpha-D-ribose 1-methylphosphonate 5-triphosphate diphosphatase [Yoonia sp. 1_MG-2023]RBW42175.1 phosphonate metabolism protein PhnM [Loktanella sp. D2R18]